MKYSPIDAIAMILEAFIFERDLAILEHLLTHDELQNYFSRLQEDFMLVYEQKNQTYKTTDRGMHFLEIYNEIEELVTPADV